MKKKAFIYDYGYYAVMLFVIALFLLVGYFSFSKINVDLLSSGSFTGTSGTIISNYESKQAGMINWFFALIFIGVFIALIIIAYSLRTYPIFAGVMILLLIVFAYLGVIFANTYYDISHSNSFSEKAKNLNIIEIIMNNFPYFIAILGFVFIIIMFGTGGGGNSQIPI